jgi:hypothetical protein
VQVLDFKTGYCINEFNFNERPTIELNTTTASVAADQQ